MLKTGLLVFCTNIVVVYLKSQVKLKNKLSAALSASAVGKWQTAWGFSPIAHRHTHTHRQERVSSPHVVCNITAHLHSRFVVVVFYCSFYLFFTCGQGRGHAQSPRTAAPPQQPSHRNLRCWRELRQPGRKVCGEAPQRCSHRHLHSLCVDFLIQCTYTGRRERAPSHCSRAPAGRRGEGGRRWGERAMEGGRGKFRLSSKTSAAGSEM